MKKIAKLIDRMGTAGISGDETDRGKEGIGMIPPRYKIGRVSWRSQELTHVMRSLDLLHLHSRFTPAGRITSGNWPRYRVESTLEVDSSPVCGLPRNCYDPIWLADQDEDALDMLDVGPAIDLTVPKHIEE